MKMKRIAFLVLALALIPFGTEEAAAQDFQIIVNASNGASAISKDDLSKIFLKKSTSWPGGGAAVAVDLKAGDATREAFSQAVHGRGASAIASYWQQQVFAGKDVPPEEKGSAAEVVAFVSGNPGAVGYVPAGTDLGSGVKVITVN
jgi:ABC-type phosphate transport system substrate-binding protein